MNRRIRVAHVITRLCVGGAQENTLQTVRLLDRSRFDVDLISGPTEGPEGSMEPLAAAWGIPILRIPGLVRDPAPVKDFGAYRDLLRLFRKRRYDIVHTHTSKAGFLGRRAARTTGAAHIVHTPHGHIFGGYFSPLKTAAFTAMDRSAAAYTDALVALNEREAADHLARRIGRPGQWRTIHSGIDFAPYLAAVEKRRETREKLGVSPEECLIGAVGRLEPVKGFPYLIEAARAVLSHHSQVRFVLAGDGSMRAALETAARDLGPRFAFLGLRDDIPELMAAFDVLALPSLNEGQGRVLMEAAAAHTPAVAANVGGVGEFVSDGETGLLVPPKNAAALAAALERLAADSDLRMALGEAARERAVPAYSVETMTARIAALYEELLGEPNGDA